MKSLIWDITEITGNKQNIVDKWRNEGKRKFTPTTKMYSLSDTPA